MALGLAMAENEMTNDIPEWVKKLRDFTGNRKKIAERQAHLEDFEEKEANQSKT